jgi:hypothetical protein
MSDLGELDRPGTPTSPGAWDTRSEEYLMAETDARDATADPAAGADKEQQTTAHPAKPPTTRRRPAADPVKALMHRHRELCERAVNPLEIAAGLEAHGLTDRTAARFRHRDVFSLAEEMYARVPRDEERRPGPPPLAAPRARADWILLSLLPGAVCAAAVAALHLTHGRPRLIAAAAGALAVALALRAALSRGPLATPHRPRPTTAWTCWLIAYALLGDGLLQAALAGGPDALPTSTETGPWPLTATPLLTLTLACAPAAWSAHFFIARARRKLPASRGLEDFTASVRPLLLATFTLFLCALAALLTATAATLDAPAPVPYAQTLALGALLFLARLLTTHGFARAPAAVLAATTTAEAMALTTTFAARLPGCGFLATPVQTLVDTWGPGGVPTAAAGVGAATLLLHATRTLTGASAHAPRDRAW